MTLPEVLEYILLPCTAWLLINSFRNASRLTRIETLLEIYLKIHHLNDED